MCHTLSQGQTRERTWPGSTEVLCSNRKAKHHVQMCLQHFRPSSSKMSEWWLIKEGDVPQCPRTQILEDFLPSPEAFLPQEINTRGENATIGPTITDQISCLPHLIASYKLCPIKDSPAGMITWENAHTQLSALE